MYTSHLDVDPEQKKAVEALYRSDKIPTFTFRADSEADQICAKKLLVDNRLDDASRRSLDDRWSSKWVYDFRYGSDCGYNHEIANVKARKNAYAFTGCLAHVEITYMTRTNAILRVRGHLEHNGGCRDAKITGKPSLSINPNVYLAALAQLQSGAKGHAVGSHRLGASVVTAKVRLPFLIPHSQSDFWD